MTKRPVGLLAVFAFLITTASLLQPPGALADQSGRQKVTCGELAEVKTTKDGDKLYSYRLGLGTVQISAPARSFKGETATDQRIRDLGMPERPERGAEREKWLRTFGRAAQTRVAVEGKTPAPPCVQLGRRAGIISLNNYNGYQAMAPSGEKFNSVSTNYIAPVPDLLTCQQASVASWAGIYGGDQNTLVQSGLFNDAYNVAFEQGAFWQVVNGPADTGGAVTFPGISYIANHTYAFESAVAKTNMVMSVWDQTDPYNSQYVTYKYPGLNHNDHYWQSTAFFISERMAFSDGHLSRYMKTGDEYFSVPQVSWFADGFLNYGGLTTLTNDEIRMHDPTGIIGSPDSSLAPDGSFTAKWKACGTIL